MLEPIGASPTRDELVYTSLRRAIVEGSLVPGQEVVATTVAAQLGVSRVPVMHACQRLVGEGFLVANPRRSVTVPPLTERAIAALQGRAHRPHPAKSEEQHGQQGATRRGRGPRS